MKYKVLAKIVDNKKIIGYRIKDVDTNKTKDVKRKKALEIVNKYNTNAKIIGNSYLVLNDSKNQIPFVPYNEIRNNNTLSNMTRKQMLENSNDISKNYIYHGSEGGIISSISCNKNKANCDFGNGFYTGEMLEQIETRVITASQGIIYELEYNIENLKEYEFKDDILWALFVGYNRTKIDINKYPKLRKIFDEIKNADIIIGYIADDKIARAYNDFLNGNITTVGLSECLKCINYGKQIVFITEKACKSITIKNHYKINNEIKQNSLLWNKNMKEKMEEKIYVIKENTRQKGIYIKECLDKYL